MREMMMLLLLFILAIMIANVLQLLEIRRAKWQHKNKMTEMERLYQSLKKNHVLQLNKLELSEHAMNKMKNNTPAIGQQLSQLFLELIETLSENKLIK